MADFTLTHDHLAQDIQDVPAFTGGLTGATAPTRYVGGTASGSPSTGTFAVGDWVIDLTGVIWICISAGTPGTWTATGSGQQLAEVEATASFNVQAVGTTVTDVTGMSLTVPAYSRVWMLHFFTETNFNTGTASTGLVLMMQAFITDNSNTQLGTSADTAMAGDVASKNVSGHIDVWVPMAAIATPTTYKVRANTLAAVPANWTTAQFLAAANNKMFFEAIGR